MLHVDVRRAYFYAAANRSIYNGIPVEDWDEGDENRVAQLDRSFYGTRDAVQNWIEEYTKTLCDMGFVAGIASPCNFVRSKIGGICFGAWRRFRGHWTNEKL